MTAPLWIPLEGAENVRDVGGLPTRDGGRVRAGRLIRSDSLQDLTVHDVRLLVDDLHVRAVADLRTGVEVAADGPGPMTREPAVRIEHLSLYPEAGKETDVAAAEAASRNEQVLLPWQSRADERDADAERKGASDIYLRYLDDRADSVLAALRMIATTDGATIVHCAAGKDRTGVVVAVALAEVGVPADAIAADYARSAERIEGIYRRLGRRQTYASDVAGFDPDRHRPRAETMQRLLAAIDERYGGVGAWLRSNGWTDVDAAGLRAALLEPADGPVARAAGDRV